MKLLAILNAVFGVLNMWFALMPDNQAALANVIVGSLNFFFMGMSMSSAIYEALYGAD